MALTGYAKREITAFTALGIAGAAVLAVIANLAGLWWVYFFCVIPAGIAGFTLFFFRDPRRTVPQGEQVVVAPADGKITEIAQVEEGNYVNAGSHKIGIFLSLFNVHLNRAPYPGKVEYLKYTPGKFLNAGNLESSKVNEANAIGIATEKCRMLLRQISGVIARRIVCELKEGDSVETGQKFGMIKFGSRTELYVPTDSGFQLRVKMGQKVKAGETVIGVFNPEDKN
jgi:phosphatidylserine decarboxylase